MHIDVGKELAALQHLTMKELRDKYAVVFGELTKVGNRAWLIKRIAWRLQSVAEGDLTEQARQRARELANEADLRLSPPRLKVPPSVPPPARVVPLPSSQACLPIPGTILTRTYKGKTLHVKVLPKGFELDGEIYRSLSAVAKAITGQHCSGFAFFGLRKEMNS